jgi:hypothetical protein
MSKFLCIFYKLKLRYLLNYVRPSKKVNKKILNIHLKLNKLEMVSNYNGTVICKWFLDMPNITSEMTDMGGKQQYDLDKNYTYKELPEKIAGMCDHCGSSYFKSSGGKGIFLLECHKCGMEKSI